MLNLPDDKQLAPSYEGLLSGFFLPLIEVDGFILPQKKYEGWKKDV